MPTLKIGDREIEIDEGFRTKTPEEQQSIVRRIKDKIDFEEGVSAEQGRRDRYYSSGIFAGEGNPLGSIAQWLRDAQRGSVSGMTFGFDEEIGLTGEAEKEAARRDSPVASRVGEAAGALALPGVARVGGPPGQMAPAALPSFMRGGAQTAGQAARSGATQGAGFGALYGAGEAEGGLRDRLMGAAQGAGIGAATGGAVGGLLGRLGRGQKIPAGQAADEMRAGSQAAYKAVDDMDIMFGRDGIQNMQRNIVKNLRDRGFTPEINPEVVGVLRQLNRDFQGNATFKGLETLRKTARAGTEGGATRESTKAMLYEIMDEIDNVIDTPSAYIAGRGSQQQASSAIREARAGWRQAAKMDDLQDAVTRARRATSTSGTGGNFENNLRREVKNILNNKRRARYFSADEKKVMDAFVEGTTGQNLLRLAGRVSPESNAAMLLTNIVVGGGGAMMGAPAALALPAAGFAAKRLADAGSRAGFRNIERLVSSGGRLPSVPPISGGRQALIDAILRSGTQQGVREAPI